LATITRFAVRNNGRVLADVRRPDRARMAVKAGVAPLESFRKAELVEMAEAKGLGTDGTKADLVERLGSVQ
jgi:hypothetical protein